jgi:hypothetical protein
VVPQAVFCPNCGAQPSNGKKFCQNCGQPTDPMAEICLKCGVRLVSAGYTVNGGNTQKLGSIKTMMLVGWIFTLLTLIGLCFYLLIAIVMGTVIGGMTNAMIPGVGVFTFGILIFEVIFLAVFTVPTILVFKRISRMRHAVDSGDITALKALDSVGWAIVALIFCGVVTGIMLLIAHSSIQELT